MVHPLKMQKNNGLLITKKIMSQHMSTHGMLLGQMEKRCGSMERLLLRPMVRVNGTSQSLSKPASASRPQRIQSFSTAKK